MSSYPQFFVIVHDDDPALAWSNDQGWVEGDSYTVFTDEEQRKLRLPIDGHWEYISTLPQE
jgi:hypothetical protein